MPHLYDQPPASYGGIRFARLNSCSGATVMHVLALFVAHGIIFQDSCTASFVAGMGPIDTIFQLDGTHCTILYHHPISWRARTQAFNKLQNFRVRWPLPSARIWLKPDASGSRRFPAQHTDYRRCTGLYSSVFTQSCVSQSRLDSSNKPPSAGHRHLCRRACRLPPDLITSVPGSFRFHMHARRVPQGSQKEHRQVTVLSVSSRRVQRAHTRPRRSPAESTLGIIHTPGTSDFPAL